MRSSLALLLATLACATTPAGETPPAPVEISGRFSEVDAVEVARALSAELTASDALQAWSRAHDARKPVLQVLPLKNRTTAHVEHHLITDALERTLVQQDRATVISPPRGPTTSNGARPADPVAPSAELLLRGTILSQEDREGGRAVFAYLVSIELVDRATDKKLWVGQARTRKLVNEAP